MTNILDTVEPLSEREIQLIDGMIEVQRNHADRCDNITNRAMAEKQKGWDMERVALLEKLKTSYSRETVERLLEEHRKQVLLEAAEVSRDAMHTTTRDGYNLACSDIRDELRRMAEGEKHE